MDTNKRLAMVLGLTMMVALCVGSAKGADVAQGTATVDPNGSIASPRTIALRSMKSWGSRRGDDG
jgi:hypothetical protein